jgi:hypothetical protein
MVQFLNGWQFCFSQSKTEPKIKIPTSLDCFKQKIFCIKLSRLARPFKNRTKMSGFQMANTKWPTNCKLDTNCVRKKAIWICQVLITGCPISENSRYPAIFVFEYRILYIRSRYRIALISGPDIESKSEQF